MNHTKVRTIALDYLDIKNSKINYQLSLEQLHSVFGVPKSRSGSWVPTELLSPGRTSNNDEGYHRTAFKLSNAFTKKIVLLG